MNGMKRTIAKTVMVAFTVGGQILSEAWGAGTLAPVGGGTPADILDHHVDVTLVNGFARTEVHQRFLNATPSAMDAIYSFPAPVSASVSEVSISHGEIAMNGEVVSKEDADRIYGEEKAAGNKAGKAEKNGYQDYKFFVANIAPGEEVAVRFVYYQPLDIDSGVARYHYPLEEGNTDDAARGFWTGNDIVSGVIGVTVTVKSGWPISAARSPGRRPVEIEERLDEGYHRSRYEETGGKLDRDFVFYYRLVEDLPGRIELIANRPDADKAGTFMMTLTPGLDLKPLESGADYLFVLDVSGSMSGGKLATLANGVGKALGELRPEDRFRIVTFSHEARDFTGGWISATPANARKWIEQVKTMRAGGGTNIYAGLKTGFRSLDRDRVVSVILVTDGVTNIGELSPKAFHKLVKSHDIRIFGFLMGNSANWPLMRMICDASGGYYSVVSNDDDIVGEIIKAKSKITHEALRDATLTISGVNILDLAGAATPGRVYRGQQLTVFGRYDGGGRATVTLEARLSGESKTYVAEFDFPNQVNDNPEIDRLYAVAKVEEIEQLAKLGVFDNKEAASAILDVGLRYQIVTDETSMIILDDDAFRRHGVARRNQARAAVERQARAERMAAPVARNYRVDTQQPAFRHSAPSLGGGGAFDPIGGIATLLALSGMAWAARKR